MPKFHVMTPDMPTFFYLFETETLLTLDRHKTSQNDWINTTGVLVQNKQDRSIFDLGHSWRMSQDSMDIDKPTGNSKQLGNKPVKSYA